MRYRREASVTYAPDYGHQHPTQPRKASVTTVSDPGFEAGLELLNLLIQCRDRFVGVNVEMVGFQCVPSWFLQERHTLQMKVLDLQQ